MQTQTWKGESELEIAYPMRMKSISKWPTPSNILYLLNLPTLIYQVRMKCSNIWAWGPFSFKSQHLLVAFNGISWSYFSLTSQCRNLSWTSFLPTCFTQITNDAFWGYLNSSTGRWLPLLSDNRIQQAELRFILLKIPQIPV